MKDEDYSFDWRGALSAMHAASLVMWSVVILMTAMSGRLFEDIWFYCYLVSLAGWCWKSREEETPKFSVGGDDV